MSLDTVELVMEIEEAFDMRFSDAEMEKIYTVGQLHQVVMEHFAAGEARLPGKIPSVVCYTAVSFYRLRRAMTTVLGVPRGRVRLETTLIELLPDESRREVWAALGESARLRLPGLVRPRWLVRMSTATVLAMFALTLPWIVFFVPNAAAVALSLLLLLILSVVAWQLTESWATEPDRDAQTIRSLAWCAAGQNLPALRAEYGRIDAHNVWETIKLLIVEQLGVPADVVTPDASFSRDLGCD